MGVLRSFITIIWRIWFYILLGLPIVVMFPFLIIFTSSERFYPQYFVCARIWAKCILYGMGFIPKKCSSAKLEKGKSYMFVANHTSITDIMLMLAVIDHPFVFLGKVELARIPLFGYFYRRTCILVDRGSQKSRLEAFAEAQRRLRQGNSICIFPEGGVPEDKFIVMAPFKDGAVRLAIDHQIPIVPITFHDNKRRFSYTFLSGSPGIMRAKIHPVVPTKNKTQADKREIKDEVFEVILKELKNPTI
ncbi:1-acyl-sn-glycerol-3-phosphate acyltransferase [Antarcticibacterium sp. 1MA-6-2]|uniref:lysophospholipid acyltransferase family protein n=1 Tax=Antarcticibacterium sp. 1MA-6-2 TaxID=2908210 RepID=UPI001F21A753|nr:lysophospholipid acyltransferase family protein [Antarcticibacterium sp. 1MA-6-2]UJH90245.1 1-acyl-sn-glycerol-3-phosphate acyltransferase [Antarcticibacterium sp. 1MA-6-2]